MKTLTICGSMRFSSQMKDIAWQLESEEGYAVIQCTYQPAHTKVKSEELARIISAHYRKIDLCDAIYVVDINGYIGESVKREIAYALFKGKEVLYHSRYGLIFD